MRAGRQLRFIDHVASSNRRLLSELEALEILKSARLGRKGAVALLSSRQASATEGMHHA